MVEADGHCYNCIIEGNGASAGEINPSTPIAASVETNLHIFAVTLTQTHAGREYRFKIGFYILRIPLGLYANTCTTNVSVASSRCCYYQLCYRRFILDYDSNRECYWAETQAVARK